ncbi:MAG: hypothetical protein AMJ62_12240 [Myxococcales bacterium SG8_38]|nr:MAG: hypothetical protein AMJ62_12240 [Myxococcales bacterium SG8_38]
MLSWLLPWRVAALSILIVSCGGSSDSAEERWLEDTSAPLPARLSEVGIYQDISTRTAYDDMISYVPNHVLYSDGLEKERHLYLRVSATIDASGSAWTFPIGTVLVKTFVDGDAPVETRLIFRTEAGWDYAIYRWLSDASDAERLEGNWPEVPVILTGGRPHTLPSRLDCRTCHETHEAVAGVPVLGIGSLQTSADLVAAGVFSGTPELEPVEGRTEEETAALRYFVGNCTSCHNGGDSINSAFSLYPDVAAANTIGEPTESETGEGIRVVPGSTEQSVLYISVVEASKPEYPGPFKVMPPLGVDIADEQAELVLRNWIESL